MQYMGGKAKIAKQLSEVILAHSAGRPGYLEPFVGGAWMLAQMAPHFKFVAAGDGMADVALLWQAVQNGWEPPAAVSRDEYAALRNAESSALRAFAGFGCSFGGKWFGGYASNNRGDDFAGAARRGIERKRAALTGVDIRHCDYRSWKFNPLRVVVYCDPPYAGTTAYAGADTWDADAFWKQATAWADYGAVVFVSEYAAPDGWQSVWSATQKGSLAASTNVQAVTEHLFMRGAS